MSEIRQAADLLRRFNAWRCGSETIEAPEPAEVTRAIALVCSAIHSDRIPEIERAAARLAVERAEFRREAETLRDRVAELEAKVADRTPTDPALAHAFYDPAFEITTKVSPEAQAVPDDVWVLQDARGMVGNAMLFWRKGGAGYTADLRGAETYTRDQAFAQHRVRDTDRPWPLTYLLERAGRMVDVQDVKPSEWHVAAQQPAGGAE